MNSDIDKAELDFATFDKYAKFITKSIGLYINMARSKSNFSVRKFAKEINVSSTVISDLENGTKIPRMETILKILWALDIPFEKIFAKDILPCKILKNHPNEGDLLRKYLNQMGLPKQDINEIMNFIAYKKIMSEILVKNAKESDFSKYQILNCILDSDNRNNLFDSISSRFENNKNGIF